MILYWKLRNIQNNLIFWLYFYHFFLNIWYEHSLFYQQFQIVDKNAYVHTKYLHIVHKNTYIYTWYFKIVGISWGVIRYFKILCRSTFFLKVFSLDQISQKVQKLLFFKIKFLSFYSLTSAINVSKTLTVSVCLISR